MRSWFARGCSEQHCIASHFPPSTRQHLAGDPAGIVGREEQHAVGDVVGRAEPLQRDAIDERALALLAVRLPLPLGRRVGAHEARRDVVDGDAPRPELVGELAREADLRRLGRRVGLDAGQADAQPGAARDVDDPPAARRLHARRHGLRAVERAGHVDVEDRLPIPGRHLLERPTDLAEHAAGVVHQDVDPARARLPPRRRGASTAALVAHVDAGATCAALAAERLGLAQARRR